MAESKESETKEKKSLTRRDFLKAGGAVFASAVVFNSLAACSSQITVTDTETATTTKTATTTQTKAETTTKTVTQTQTETAIPEATPAVVTDMTGRQVTIPANVSKIAVGFPALNQLVAMLGGVDKLVCRDYYITGVPWFVKLYPQIEDLPLVFLSTALTLKNLPPWNPMSSFSRRVRAILLWLISWSRWVLLQF
jgi:ABC-type Fe3+-hydroxamate transport system substrate-binding protein